MTLKKILVEGTDDLFVPDFNQNIYKVFPTVLRCMGVQVPRDDLFNITEVRRHLKQNDALFADRVIVCLVDSLSINNIKGSMLESLFDELSGVILSSTFPSITSTAITSIHHGVPPTEHGILGNRIFFQEYDTIVDTLRMTGGGVRSRDAIPRAGINVRSLLWTKPIFELLKQHPGTPVIHADGLPGQIAGTGLGHFFTNIPNLVSYADYIDAFGMTRRVLEKFPGQPLFITLYFGIIDRFAHKYGPNSQEYKEGCDAFIRQLRIFLEGLAPALAKKTTVVICSDHGQNPLRTDREIMFTEEEIAEVKGTLRVPPGHSGRIMHFYCVNPAKRRWLKRWLQDYVDDRAIIYDARDVNKARLLSKPINRAISQRLGDLLLICRDGVKAFVQHEYEVREDWGLLPEIGLLGGHGSLTADEMFPPFLAFNANVLR